MLFRFLFFIFLKINLKEKKRRKIEMLSEQARFQANKFGLPV